MSLEVVTKTKAMIDELKKLSPEEFYKGLKLCKSSALDDSHQSDPPDIFVSNGRINANEYEALLIYADQAKIIVSTLQMLDVFEDLDWLYCTQMNTMVELHPEDFDNDYQLIRFDDMGPLSC